MIKHQHCNLKVVCHGNAGEFTAGGEKMRWKIFILILIVTGLSGCASIGPRTVTRDRFDYISAISESWKAQMLFNLVKIRYGDTPVFLDVASVITQTGVQGTLGVSGSWWQNP